MASKGYELEWQKKIRLAAQRAAAWLRVQRKRLEELPVEERKRLEKLRVEWEVAAKRAAKKQELPVEERKRLEKLRVEWEVAKRAAKKLAAERIAQHRAAWDAFQREKEAKKRAVREKEFKKRLKKLGTPTADYMGSVRGKIIAREETIKRAVKKQFEKLGTPTADYRTKLTRRGKTFVLDSMVVEALAEALARRILTMQSKRRKVMLTGEVVTEVSLSPILCRIPQAAAMIGRGTRFIYEAIATGKIEAVKSDKRTLVIVQSLHNYVKTLDKAKIRPMARHTRRRCLAD